MSRGVYVAKVVCLAMWIFFDIKFYLPRPGSLLGCSDTRFHKAAWLKMDWLASSLWNRQALLFFFLWGDAFVDSESSSLSELSPDEYFGAKGAFPCLLPGGGVGNFGPCFVPSFMSAGGGVTEWNRKRQKSEWESAQEWLSYGPADFCNKLQLPIQIVFLKCPS